MKLNKFEKERLKEELFSINMAILRLQEIANTHSNTVSFVELQTTRHKARRSEILSILKSQ